MKTLIILIAISIIAALMPATIFAQQYGTYNFSTSTYQRELTKTSSTNPTSGGLNNGSNLNVGSQSLSGTTYYYRSFYQWNLPNSTIPPGATIDTVELHYEYYMNISGNHPLSANLYDGAVDLVNPNLSTLWSNSEDPNHEIAGNQTGSQGIFDATYGPGSEMVYFVQNELSSQKFILGITYAYETTYDSTWYVRNSSVKLRIVFTEPSISVVVNQKLSTGAITGTIGRWNGSTFPTPRLNPGTPINTYVGATEVLQGDQSIESGQKYNNWTRNNVAEPNILNHHAFLVNYNDNNYTSNFGPANNATVQAELLENSGLMGHVDFMDPWLIDNPDPNHGNFLQNEGVSAPFKSVSSATNDISTSTSYKGVFLGLDPSHGAANYYSVRAPLIQTISVNGQNHTSYFQNWNPTNAQLQQVDPNPQGYDQKAVVFTGSNATVTANYKATQLSNDASAFSDNSQRRLIETQSGGATWLHMVYTSMGHVWIEHSSDDGNSWILGNNGQPLDGTTGGKNPSIAYTTYSPNYNYIGVVWQQPYNSTYQICGQVFNQSISTSMVPSYWSPTTGVIYTEPSDAYSVNALPNLVLTGTAFGPYFITFERKSASGSWQPGINWLVGHITNSGTGWDGTFGSYQQNGLISGTNASTTNTQISEDPAESGSSVIAVNFIRQQGSPGTIYSHYLYLYQPSGSYWDYYQYNDGMISYNSAVNLSPSIVNLFNGYYAACWLEYSDMTYYYYGNHVRYYFGSNGSNAQSCSINRGGSNSSGRGFAAWSQYGTSWYNKSIRFDNGIPVTGSISTLSTSGKYVQVGNGAASGLSDMHVSSFYPFTAPYYFKTSGALSPLSKSNSLMAEGRGFTINKGDASFSYRFGDLNVDGNYIGFADVPDTSDFGNVDVLNNALVTEPFRINANSKISFTERSGFADSAAAVNALGKSGFIHYKIELIDNTTGNTLGTIKDMNITSANSYSLKDPSYSLNTEGLSGITVKAKIIVETNLNSAENSLDEASTQFLQNDKIPAAIRNACKNVRHSNIILTKSFMEVSASIAAQQAKAGLQLNLQGTDVPKTYALTQNYPNPFNPSTTIHYELPNNGFVTLKVYDVLGNHVKTLVNQY